MFALLAGYLLTDFLVEGATMKKGVTRIYEKRRIYFLGVWEKIFIFELSGGGEGFNSWGWGRAKKGLGGP